MFNKKNLLVIALLLVFVFSLAACSNQQEAAPETEQEQTPAEQSTAPDNPDVILATTTSTQDSGLLDVLIPIFEEETGYVIKTITVLR
jgi:tungstate transport system substrate-binding protein